MFKLKYRFCALTCAVLLLLSSALCAPQRPSAVHQIILDSIADTAECSSTAVGPHTLLTAAHCVVGTGLIMVDDKSAKIVNMIYDEHEHVLIVVDGIEFAATVPIDQREPNDNEHVQIWGWPGESKEPVHRDGYYIKQVTSEDGIVIQKWQLPVFEGDSGSGLISDDGKIIAVVSTGDKSARAGSVPIQFSLQQQQQIK